MQIIMVNCDKREKEFKEHLAEMPWLLAVPFENTEIINKLEDMAEAETIPRLSIINLQKSASEVAIKDAKRFILKKQSMVDAVEDVRQEILNAW